MMEKLQAPMPRRVAGVLMLLSGVTHVVQLYFYPANHSAWGASVFGAIYFALGVWRFLQLHRNPFSVFHVAVDLVVVPCCIYMLACRDK